MRFAVVAQQFEVDSESHRFLHSFVILSRDIVINVCLHSYDLDSMAKQKFAHLSLYSYLDAVCKVNYRKSVTIRKIIENSTKLDQEKYCNLMYFKMTTICSQLLRFPQSELIDHQNFPLFPLYQCKY